MSAIAIVLILLVGAFGGWLAGLAARGRGLGPVGNPGVGILGAFGGARMLDLMGGGAVMIGLAALFVSFVGAALLLAVMARLRGIRDTHG